MSRKNMVSGSGYNDFNQGASNFKTKNYYTSPIFKVEDQKETKSNDVTDMCDSLKALQLTYPSIFGKYKYQSIPFFTDSLKALQLTYPSIFGKYKYQSIPFFTDSLKALQLTYPSIFGKYKYQSNPFTDSNDKFYWLDSKGGLWNHGIVAYSIDIEDNELGSMVEKAINKYNETITNVCWRSCWDLKWGGTIVNNIMSPWLGSSIKFVRDDKSCPWSYVGCLRVKDQSISLCKYFPKSKSKIQIGNILHEMTHALGFGHTHQRWDRNDYLKINAPAKEDAHFRTNYKNKSQYTIGGYDFESIMHYPTGKYYKMQCINPKNDIFTGKRERFSENDVDIINSLYYYEAQRRKKYEQQKMYMSLKVWK
eukprot:511301_1